MQMNKELEENAKYISTMESRLGQGEFDPTKSKVWEGEGKERGGRGERELEREEVEEVINLFYLDNTLHQ